MRCKNALVVAEMFSVLIRLCVSDDARDSATPTDSMIKAVMFDVDGTLVDSVDLHARAWKRHSFSRNPHADRKGRRPTRAGVMSKAELDNYGE
jgi:hypothetical protein